MAKPVRNDEILKAAEKAYEVSGLEKVTVTEICDRADISRKTFYQRFKNLNELFDAVIASISNKAAEKIDKNKEKEDIDIWEQLWWIFDVCKEIADEHSIIKAVYRSRFERWVSWKQMYYADRLDAVIESSISEIINFGIEAGKFRKVDVISVSRATAATLGVIFFLLDDSPLFPVGKVEGIKEGLKTMLRECLKPVGIA